MRLQGILPSDPRRNNINCAFGAQHYNDCISSAVLKREIRVRLLFTNAGFRKCHVEENGLRAQLMSVQAGERIVKSQPECEAKGPERQILCAFGRVHRSSSRVFFFTCLPISDSKPRADREHPSHRETPRSEMNPW